MPERFLPDQAGSKQGKNRKCKQETGSTKNSDNKSISAHGTFHDAPVFR
jgi:hypothetical protein